MEIGGQLRKIRVCHGYSQQYVADYLGISRNAYIAWEKDSIYITVHKLELVCELYDISFCDFIMTVPQVMKRHIA